MAVNVKCLQCDIVGPAIFGQHRLICRSTCKKLEVGEGPIADKVARLVTGAEREMFFAYLSLDQSGQPTTAVLVKRESISANIQPLRMEIDQTRADQLLMVIHTVGIAESEFRRY